MQRSCMCMLMFSSLYFMVLPLPVFPPLKYTLLEPYTCHVTLLPNPHKDHWRHWEWASWAVKHAKPACMTGGQRWRLAGYTCQ